MNFIRTAGSALGLLAVAAAANAQTTIYQNDGGVNQLGTGRASVINSYAAVNGMGVGYSNQSSDGFAPLFNTFNANGRESITAATAQTVFQPFVFSGPSTSVGTQVFIGLHGTAFDEASGGANSVTMYASVFTNSAASGVPVPGTLVLGNEAITFKYPGLNTDQFFISGTSVALSGALTNGGNYVFVIAPSTTVGATNPSNAGVVDSVNGGANPGGTYVTNNDSANTDTNSADFTAVSTTGPIGFRLITPAVAPEPGENIGLALGGFGLVALIARRRRCA